MVVMQSALTNQALLLSRAIIDILVKVMEMLYPMHTTFHLLLYWSFMGKMINGPICTV